MNDQLVVVTGAGGFIGGHLVADLLRRGHTHVRAVDRKPLTHWYQKFDQADNHMLDLMHKGACEEACSRRIRNLQPGRRHGRHGLHREQQSPMHAVGADQHAHADGRARSTASSASSMPRRPASITPTSRRDPNVTALQEEDAYPAMPEDGYGWEKLFSERMCRHFREDFGLETRVARYPQRLWPARHLGRRPREGARRHLPQGDRRPRLSGKHEIEIWGDGQQTRSFMYIDDCLQGIADDHAQRHSSSRSTSAAANWSRSTSSSTSSKTSPASSSSAATT